VDLCISIRSFGK